MGERVHRDVCKKNKILVTEKWYEPKLVPLTENAD